VSLPEAFGSQHALTPTVGLGAVAVAGWWTTLDRRVKDQVSVLYDDHKTEIGQKLADFLAEQQREMSDRLGTVQTNLQSVESRISAATTDIDELEKLTHDFFDVAVDGIMHIGAGFLEGWAKRATATHKFPRVPVKMAESYLVAVEYGLAEAERDVMRDKDKVSASFERLKEKAAATDSGIHADRLSLYALEIRSINEDLHVWLKRDAGGAAKPLVH
jgi:hypothetical protein